MINRFIEIQKVMNPELILLDIKTDESAQMIRIIIDSERPITLSDTTGLMKLINNDDELNSLFPDSHGIEISSLGMGAELKQPFQYRKNVGRMIELKIVEDGKYVKRLGILASVTDNGILFEQDQDSIEIDFDAIKSAKIKISFN